MMVFIPLVFVLIGQFCCDVIGHQNVNVAVISRLLFLLFLLLFFIHITTETLNGDLHLCE